jgi:hypothetical protein
VHIVSSYQKRFDDGTGKNQRQRLEFGQS